MPKPKINGSLLPQRKSVKIKSDPNNGQTTTQEFECAGDGLAGLAKQFEAAGASVDMVINPVRSSLVAVSTKNIFATDDEQVLERWELFANQQQLDLKEHPTFAALDVDQRWQILKDVENHLNGKNASSGLDWDDPAEWGALAVSRAEAFYALMIRGMTHYLFPQWVVRVTFNAPNAEVSVNTNGGIGTIYSTSELGIPAGRLRSVVQSISAPAAVTGLTWGWLVVSHTEITTAKNRVDVSEEAWLGQWPDIVYG